VVLLKTFFECRWNLQLDIAVAGDFLIRDKLNNGQCLTLQTVTNKATNKGMYVPMEKYKIP